MLCKSEREIATHALRLIFSFLRVPWDLDFQSQVVYTKKVNIEGSTEILPDLYILSFKPKGNDVCICFNPFKFRNKF